MFSKKPIIEDDTRVAVAALPVPTKVVIVREVHFFFSGDRRSPTLTCFSSSLALSKRTAQIWFQNARARMKKKPCATTSSPPTYAGLMKNSLNLVDPLHLSTGKSRWWLSRVDSSFSLCFQTSKSNRKQRHITISITIAFSGHQGQHRPRLRWFTMEKIATKNTPLDTSSYFAENMNHLCDGMSESTGVSLSFSSPYLSL